jgi:hypothetical protein
MHSCAQQCAVQECNKRSVVTAQSAPWSAASAKRQAAGPMLPSACISLRVSVRSKPQSFSICTTVEASVHQRMRLGASITVIHQHKQQN